MRRRVIKTISDIEIEEILAEYFNSFDALLKIENTEDGQMVYAEIVNYEFEEETKWLYILIMMEHITRVL